MSKTAPQKRHQVSIWRVPKATTVAARGQRAAATELVGDLPASIEMLSGRELETARQLYATAQYRVRFHGEEAWAITAADYLQRVPEGTRLDIGHVGDLEGTHFEYTLLCSEEKQAT